MKGNFLMRIDSRGFDKLRNVKITKGFLKHAEGSCLIELGDTKVICSATVEENVPPFLKGSGTGWVTAEYGMIPRSCKTRVLRDKTLVSGRTHEISRLIGRCLRSIIDMSLLGERTVKLDCDVIQADGGTRTASITGSFIALVYALVKIKRQGLLNHLPMLDYVAATSVGILGGKEILDLNYEEDSKAEVDMNVVMCGRSKLIEVQGTAEKEPFERTQMDKLLNLAEKGIKELFAMQKELVGDFLDL